MPDNASFKIMLSAFFIMTSLFFPPLMLHGESALDLMIICNKDVPDEQLSKTTLKNIYIGKKREWSNGQIITIVTLKEGNVHDHFCKNYVNKTSAQFSAYWKKMLFSGKALMPKNFDQEQKIINFVAQTEGAIGYVSAGLNSDQVKTIEVN